MDADDKPRIDRVLDPSFVDGLDEVSSEELRKRIATARAEEDKLSYQRRVAHAQLDILQSELDRRRGGGSAPSAEEAVDQLKSVLVKGVGGSRGARSRLPSGLEEIDEGMGVEQMVAEDFLARLPDLADEEISAAVERVREVERPISEDRHRLHGVIDRLEAELVGRYKSGALSPSDILGREGDSEVPRPEG